MVRAVVAPLYSIGGGESGFDALNWVTGAAFAVSSGVVSGAGSAPGATATESAAEISSPSSKTIAIGVLTATPSVPSATKILPSTPSSTASNSMVALSVSISAITSPLSTASPSSLTHLANLPSVIVGDSAGIRI